MILSKASMYGLHDYARMIADRVRIAAYVRALEATVRSGSVVVDVGTGPGILALVACRLGARRVYAIDTNDTIDVARELALENGCADRITFIKQDAREVSLPEQADVIVSDLRGALPLAAANLDVVADVRERFLAPGGALIPMRDILRVSVAQAPTLYDDAVGLAVAAGVTLSAMRARLVNDVHIERNRSLRAADLVTSGEAWAVVDYSAVHPTVFQGRVHWTIGRDCVGHGLAVWFDTILVDDIGFSTAPGNRGVYPQFFLPWNEPVTLRAGDIVEVALWAGPQGQPWAWSTEVSGADGAKRAYYKQSSFLGTQSKLRRFETSVSVNRSEVSRGPS